MNAAILHVRIGRLVVEASMQPDAAHWEEAITHALQERLAGARPHAPSPPVPQAIAGHVARRLPPSTRGGDHAGD